MEEHLVKAEIQFLEGNLEAMRAQLRRLGMAICTSVAEGSGQVPAANSVLSVRMARTAQAEMTYCVEMTRAVMNRHTPE